MRVAEHAPEQVVDRTLPARQDQAEGELRALVDAALAVMRRVDVDGLTVADVLSEAGLSTRAFYRVFRSKDELVLAVFEHERRRAAQSLQDSVQAAETPRAQLDAWIDDVLGLGFDPRRARRTRVLFRQGARIRHDFPEEFRVILSAELSLLSEILRQGTLQGVFAVSNPEHDAAMIHALVWSLVEAHLAGATETDLTTARSDALRYIVPAIGASE